MARPKYGDNDILATEKLFNSFWGLLEEHTYSDISVVKLCKIAGINKNTFYYHFDNLDDMAVSLIESSMDEQFAICVLQAALTDNVQDFDGSDMVSKGQEQFKHLCLLVGNHSHPLLINTLKESVLKVWLKLLKKTEEEMSMDLYIAATFAINGLFSLLALNNREKNFARVTIPELLQKDFIRDILKTIVHIINPPV